MPRKKLTTGGNRRATWPHIRLDLQLLPLHITIWCCCVSPAGEVVAAVGGMKAIVVVVALIAMVLLVAVMAVVVVAVVTFSLATHPKLLLN